jgi:hypothetical protein
VKCDVEFETDAQLGQEFYRSTELDFLVVALFCDQITLIYFAFLLLVD